MIYGPQIDAYITSGLKVMHVPKHIYMYSEILTESYQ